MHKVLDLFAGIGGFSLGLEKTGYFKTIAFCENDTAATRILKKHWQDVPIFDDIRNLTNEKLKTAGIVPSVITGGFPCTDASKCAAGKQCGIIGERSGLWTEMFRIVKNARPAWVIIENVSALRSKGLTLVLQNLCEIGYMSEFHCIPASYFGAWHHRSRVWILARCDTNCKSEPIVTVHDEAQRMQEYARYNQWAKPPTESAVLGVAHGIPQRVDRLRLLGNSVVPQIVEYLGKQRKK